MKQTIFFMAVLSLLSACAAPPPADPCARACKRVYESCMDSSYANPGTHAYEMTNLQCSNAQQSCETACRQHP